MTSGPVARLQLGDGFAEKIPFLLQPSLRNGVVLFQRLMRREDMEIKIDIEVFAQLSWPCLSHRHVAESRARVGARRHCSAQVTVPRVLFALGIS